MYSILRFRSLSLLFLLIVINSCGGSNNADLTRTRSIVLGDLCNEVNQVVAISLNQHAYRELYEADEIYSKAIHRMILTIASLDSNLARTQSFSSSVTKLKNRAEATGVSALNNCEDLRAMDQIIEQAEQARQRGEWYPASDSSWGLLLNRRSEAQIYRIFLSTYAKALDGFSRYALETREGSYSFGIRTNEHILRRLDRKRHEIEGLEIIGVDRGRYSQKIKNEDLPQVGDQIVAIQIGPKAAEFISESVLQGRSAHDWIHVKDFFHANSNWTVTSLLTENEDDSISIRIKRGTEILDLKLKGIDQSSMVPATSNVYGRIHENFLYVRMFEFGDGLAMELNGEIERLKSEWVKLNPGKSTDEVPLILDLRFNPGGSLNEVQRVASLFLSPGIAGQLRERDSDGEYMDIPIRTSSFGKVHSNPLFVLQNGFSASASEFINAIFIETERATVIGEPSFGKFFAQFAISIGAVSELKGVFWFTGGVFMGPKGKTYYPEGIPPTVLVKDPVLSRMLQDCQKSNRECFGLRAEEIMELDREVHEHGLFSPGKTVTEELAFGTKALPVEENFTWTALENESIQKSKDPQLEAAILLAKKDTTRRTEKAVE